MIIQRIQDIEEYNIGILLGKPDIGVRVRRFTDKKIGKNYFGSNYSLEYYTIEPGTSYPVPVKSCNRIYIMLLGNVLFEGETDKGLAKTGDIIYIKPGEISSVRNTGDEQAEILCCADN